jgi:hypothetical protein
MQRDACRRAVEGCRFLVWMQGRCRKAAEGLHHTYTVPKAGVAGGTLLSEAAACPQSMTFPIHHRHIKVTLGIKY